LMAQLWNHSLGCAVAAREIALRGHHGNPDEAFLTGLVHDIGRVFLLSTLEQISRDDARVRSLSDVVLAEVLDSFHEEMGAQLLKEWGFPDAVTSAVRCHHQPDKAEDHKPMAWLVRAADLTCHKLGLGGQAEEDDLSLVNTPAMQALRLTDIAIADLLVTLEDKMAEMDLVFAN